MRITSYLLIYAFIFCSPAFATDKDSDIDTNRPSFTFSPIVVPKGSLQVENGTLYQWIDRGQGRFDIPETQLRLGLLEKTEFQISAPNFILNRSEGQTSSGVTDLGEVGIKQQLPRFRILQASVVASMNLPTGGGRRFLSGPGVQPVFRLPMSIPLGKHYQFCAMPSFLLLDSGRAPSYQQTAMLCRSIGRKTNVFVEYGGFFTRELPPINFAHFGAEYKITPRNQVDLHFGFGLNRDAPTAFLGGGYSFRIDKLWPSK
ncbi:MAG: hypothetical protein C0469_15305 [Cyanobacteria bacterium DS2.3.42]|nr:hypothetical protein [Cyanobacteria bacterium DS2.3.42]